MNAPEVFSAREPLQAFPRFRSQDASESQHMVSRVFCPHELRQVDNRTRFALRHNLVRLGETAVNFLSYGAEVDITPGRLDSFYLVQMPLKGTADIRCGDQQVLASPNTASILNPHEHTRMRWKSDAEKLMLWIPRKALEQRLTEHLGEAPDAPLAFDLALPTQHGLTRSWCRLMHDVVSNIDQCGADWLAFRPTIAALEDCLIRGLLQLHHHNYSDRLHQPDHNALPRHVQRAVDFMQAHAEDAITVSDIAAAACISVRALEEGFRRHCDTTPLVYLRDLRLDRVRQTLLRGAATAEPITVLALRYGFAHLGRFAGYYRTRFGETPSQTAARTGRD
ncbi:AraC family transcriptional regulator [Zoogloeaceae bacterium G21618-S1]|nr:AraC family transcriptional regulator [Zoogloeaceae bacterium G21618-S1]